MISLEFVTGSNLFSTWTTSTSGAFVAVAVLLSLYLISEHLSAYNLPEEQKFLIGLILMVPVYGVQSFLSLLNPDTAFLCEVIRDCYEAFAMYCFERYLIACLGGEDNTIKIMETEVQSASTSPLLDLEYDNAIVKHPFPLNCFLRNWHLGPDFYQAVKIGIVQYMILKPICAIFAIIFELFGVYGEGKFELRYGYPYLAVILNFSQTWALYCLIQFYSVTKEKLEHIKPLAKFLVFKSIVFLTWWQGVAVAFLFSAGVLKGRLAQQLQMRIQDYIICIEMCIAAVAHLKVFPAKPYIRGERCMRNVAVMSDYASLGAPPDPEELRDGGKLTKMMLASPDYRERRLSLPQSVRDVVLGSGEIMVDDVKFTVSHVVEPMERGLSKINATFHQISKNVKQLEKRKRKWKDDSHLIRLDSWAKDFPEAYGLVTDGSISDGGVDCSRQQGSATNQRSFTPKSAPPSRHGSFGFGGTRMS